MHVTKVQSHDGKKNVLNNVTSYLYAPHATGLALTGIVIRTNFEVMRPERVVNNLYDCMVDA